LGWRFGLEPEAYGNLTLFEAIDKAAALGLSYVGASTAQKVSRDINHSFGPELSTEEQSQLRSRLDSAGVRLLTCSVQNTPLDEDAWRNLFEFGRKMGVETFIASPQPEALDSLERLCEDYGMSLALSSRESGGTPVDWAPGRVLKSCKHRSKRVGACADLRAWLRSGIDPVRAARQLKDRLLTVQLHDLDVRGRRGVDVSWGTGAGNTGKFLEELSRLNVKPTMFAMAYDEPASPGFDPVQSIRFFNQTTLELPVQPTVRNTQ
jgi:sugar phosphate isomerase/epimerase